MFSLLQDIAQKGAAIVMTSFVAVFGFIPHLISLSGGFIAQPNTVVITPTPEILILPAQTSTELIQQASTTITATTTIVVKNLTTSTTRINSSSSSSLPQPQKQKIAEKTKIQEPKSLPVSIATPKVFTPHLRVSGGFTPKLILDATGFSINQRVDGAYRLTLHTTTTVSSGSNPEQSRGIDWDLSTTNIGGTASTPHITNYVAGSIPKLDTSFSCDPQPNTVPSDSPDQNPTFNINTSYTCVISLTDSLLRKESKKINFKTGVGRLTIRASNLDTVLKYNKSTNGFVLDNQSAGPVILTGITFDVSFTALNTSSPIILRFLEPDNESMLVEYPLQNLSDDSTHPYTHTEKNMKASFSFTVKPGGQRLLMVQILGVQPLAIFGINPRVTITLGQISIDRSDIKTTLFSPIISWSCIPYDPTHAAEGLPNEQNCK